jgi:hypothetical protein
MVYDAKKADGPILKRTLSPLGRKLYDDPVMKARAAQAEADKHSPVSKLRERHAQQENAIRQEYVKDAKKLEDKYNIAASELRMRNTAHDMDGLTKLGTTTGAALQKIKDEQKARRDRFEKDLESHRERAQAELDKAENGHR